MQGDEAVFETVDLTREVEWREDGERYAKLCVITRQHIPSEGLRRGGYIEKQ